MYISDHYKTKLKCILNENNRLCKLMNLTVWGIVNMMERSPLQNLSWYILGKVTFAEHVNVLERYYKDDISYTFKNLNGSLF